MSIGVPAGGFSDELIERVVDAVLAGADELAVGLARQDAPPDYCSMCLDSTPLAYENASDLGTIRQMRHIVGEAVTLIGFTEHGDMEFDPGEYDWVSATLNTTYITEYFARCAKPRDCEVCRDDTIEKCGHWEHGDDCPQRGPAP